MSRSIYLFALWLPISSFGMAQQESFPLQDVKIAGSTVPVKVVMDIGGLKLGQSVNQAAIEEACQKLGQSGIFEDVRYAYAVLPNKAYLVTLQLTDPQKMMESTIDLPGVDEGALWKWIGRQFPKFQHRVPQSDEAQQYIAKMLERKLGDSLHGERVVTRLEQNFLTKREEVSSAGAFAENCRDEVRGREPCAGGRVEAIDAEVGGQRRLYGTAFPGRGGGGDAAGL